KTMTMREAFTSTSVSTVRTNFLMIHTKGRLIVKLPTGFGFLLFLFQLSLFSVQTYGQSNALPTVSVTSPAVNSVFAAPGTVGLTAEASDADGTVVLVEYYSGTGKIGEATAS